VAVAAAAFVLLALPAVAAAGEDEGITFPAGFETGLQVKSSRGYTIRIDGTKDPRTGKETVTLTANRGKTLLRAQAGRAFTSGASATYFAPGTATTTKLRARFGKLGKVSLKFHRVGKPKKTPPTKECKGGKTTTLNGVWKGRIRFRGEHGYTKVNVTSASGSVEKSAKQTCHFPISPTPHVTSLSAGRSNTSFYVDKRRSSSRATFQANVVESMGAVSIDRFVVANAPASKFTFDVDAGTATMKPPAPFRGQAFLASNTWTGSLKVSFPGKNNVALTGAEWFVSLSSS